VVGSPRIDSLSTLVSIEQTDWRAHLLELLAQQHHAVRDLVTSINPTESSEVLRWQRECQKLQLRNSALQSEISILKEQLEIVLASAHLNQQPPSSTAAAANNNNNNNNNAVTTSVATPQPNSATTTTTTTDNQPVRTAVNQLSATDSSLTSLCNTIQSANRWCIFGVRA
jgi:phage/plasmid-associated DNA primase